MLEKNENENPFLIMGFWEFTIIATLMTVFFPWSLLFCVIFYGLEHTKLLVIALLHDFVKTVLAILLGIFCIIVTISFLVVVFVG